MNEIRNAEGEIFTPVLLEGFIGELSSRYDGKPAMRTILTSPAQFQVFLLSGGAINRTPEGRKFYGAFKWYDDVGMLDDACVIKLSGFKGCQTMLVINLATRGLPDTIEKGVSDRIKV